MTDERIEPQSRAGLTQDHRVSDLVRDVMSPRPRMLRAEATISPEESVGQAVRLMREKAIRRLPVVEHDEVVGMLTIGDIAVERDSRTALADISAAPPNT